VACSHERAERVPRSWVLERRTGVYKSFFLGERFKLQFPSELYNAFNHANLCLNGGDAEVEGPYLDAYENGHRTVQLVLRLVF
jgi:hypothetical protein